MSVLSFVKKALAKYYYDREICTKAEEIARLMNEKDELEDKVGKETIQAVIEQKSRELQELIDKKEAVRRK